MGLWFNVADSWKNEGDRLRVSEELIAKLRQSTRIFVGSGGNEASYGVLKRLSSASIECTHRDRASHDSGDDFDHRYTGPGCCFRDPPKRLHLRGSRKSRPPVLETGGAITTHKTERFNRIWA
jgi:hypothetical protein